MIGDNKTQLRGNLFPKYVANLNYVYVMKNKHKNWHFSGVSSLREISVGAISGISYGNAAVDKYLATRGPQIVLISIPEWDRRIKELAELKKVEAILIDELSLSRNLVPGFIHEKTIAAFPNYISFTHQKGEEKKLVKQFEDKFENIYKNGVLRNIYRKYGIERKINLVTTEFLEMEEEKFQKL